jgi:hypothetical protein
MSRKPTNNAAVLKQPDRQPARSMLKIKFQPWLIPEGTRRNNALCTFSESENDDAYTSRLSPHNSQPTRDSREVFTISKIVPKNYLGVLIPELVLYIVESYLWQTAAPLRLVNRHLNTILREEFMNRHFRTLVVRFDRRCLERLAWVSYHAHLYVRKVIIDTQSLLVRAHKSEAPTRQPKGLYEESFSSSNTLYWHTEAVDALEDILAHDIFGALLPSLSNVEELVLNQLPNTEHVRHSSFFRLEGLCSRLAQQILYSMQYWSLKFKVLKIFGLEVSSCLPGVPEFSGEGSLRSLPAACYI